jgi:hypothetical protein
LPFASRLLEFDCGIIPNPEAIRYSERYGNGRTSPMSSDVFG